MCDYRRAVVVISIVYMVWYSIAIIVSATGSGLAAGGAFGVDGADLDLSDEDQQDLTEDAFTLAVLCVIYAILLCFAIFGLVAALRYSVCMLGTGVFFILVQFGYSIYEIFAFDSYNTGGEIGVIIALIIGYGLFLYPVIGLITEIKSGVMSCETYPREGMLSFCSNLVIYMYFFPLSSPI